MTASAAFRRQVGNVLNSKADPKTKAFTIKSIETFSELEKKFKEALASLYEIGIDPGAENIMKQSRCQKCLLLYIEISNGFDKRLIRDGKI